MDISTALRRIRSWLFTTYTRVACIDNIPRRPTDVSRADKSVSSGLHIHAWHTSAGCMTRVEGCPHGLQRYPSPSETDTAVLNPPWTFKHSHVLVFLGCHSCLTRICIVGMAWPGSKFEPPSQHESSRLHISLGFLSCLASEVSLLLDQAIFPSRACTYVFPRRTPRTQPQHLRRRRCERPYTPDITPWRIMVMSVHTHTHRLRKTPHHHNPLRNSIVLKLKQSRTLLR